MVPAGYTHVNRDTLKTPQKCLKAAEEALADGKSVVVRTLLAISSFEYH
jgi:bifunctional polynucleotide phosphatase/kinase